MAAWDRTRTRGGKELNRDVDYAVTSAEPSVSSVRMSLYTHQISWAFTRRERLRLIISPSTSSHRTAAVAHYLMRHSGAEASLRAINNAGENGQEEEEEEEESETATNKGKMYSTTPSLCLRRSMPQAYKYQMRTRGEGVQRSQNCIMPSCCSDN